MPAKRGDAGTLKSAVAKIGAQIVRVAARGATATRGSWRRLPPVRICVRPPYGPPCSAMRSCAFPSTAKATPPSRRRPVKMLSHSPVFCAWSHRSSSPRRQTGPSHSGPQPIADTGNGQWNWLGAIQLGGAGAPIVAVANGVELRLSTNATLPFPGGPTKVAPSPEGVFATRLQLRLQDGPGAGGRGRCACSARTVQARSPT